ncbi:MAG: alpha/beta hydrolase, partial [Gammaproteobacteria bacterium]|nr:alpha/beta hydrolase [Gammaproteobacteria bacterium]
WDLREQGWEEWYQSVLRGFQIVQAYNHKIHLIGFSTGGALCLKLAAMHSDKLCSVVAINTPLNFKNKNMKFIPLIHKANKLVRWGSSMDGVKPFIRNQSEHPHINYQNIPVRALYELQQVTTNMYDSLQYISCKVDLYQATNDPVVEPNSGEAIYKAIGTNNKSLTMIEADHHGILYQNTDDIQSKVIQLLEACNE